MILRPFCFIVNAAWDMHPVVREPAADVGYSRNVMACAVNNNGNTRTFDHITSLSLSILRQYAIVKNNSSVKQEQKGNGGNHVQSKSRMV